MTGAELKSIRLGILHFSQHELATWLSFSVREVQKWESSKVPIRESIVKSIHTQLVLERTLKQINDLKDKPADQVMLALPGIVEAIERVIPKPRKKGVSNG